MLAVELEADAGADGADGRVVAGAQADAVFDLGQPDGPPVGPDVAAVDEEHAAEGAGDREAVFEVDQQQAVAAYRDEPAAVRVADERLAADAELVLAVGAVRGVAAGEEALGDRHVAAGEVEHDAPRGGD